MDLHELEKVVDVLNERILNGFLTWDPGDIPNAVTTVANLCHIFGWVLPLRPSFFLLYAGPDKPKKVDESRLEYSCRFMRVDINDVLGS